MRQPARHPSRRAKTARATPASQTAPVSTARKKKLPRKKTRPRVRPFADLQHPNARAQRAFLLAYAKAGTITHAAASARLDRSTHLHWLHYPGPAGEQYLVAFAQAQDMAADALEDAARRRAVEGLKRYRFTKDGTPLRHPLTDKPYYEQEYSDSLLGKLLEANRPEKFRSRVEHTGAGGGPIAHQVDVDVSLVPTDRLRQIRQWLLEARNAAAPDPGGPSELPVSLAPEATR